MASCRGCCSPFLARGVVGSICCTARAYGRARGLFCLCLKCQPSPVFLLAIEDIGAKFIDNSNDNSVQRVVILELSNHGTTGKLWRSSRLIEFAHHENRRKGTGTRV